MATLFSAADTNPLIRKLESVFSLSEGEREAILALTVQERQIGPRQDVVREGDRPTRSFAILKGVACAFKITGEAKRQILAFHIVGDIPDLQSLLLEKLDISVSTISPCTVAFIQHDALLDLCSRHARLASALWRETLVYASIFRESVVNVGRREAYSRAAHLLCEFMVRLRVMGLASEYSCEMPMTQVDLADAMGLSIVHVNRVLQELRKKDLIQLGQGSLTVLDWRRL
jgi:CRP-like cAMP-binding protein